MSGSKDLTIFHDFQSLYYKIIAEILAEILEDQKNGEKNINKDYVKKEFAEMGLQGRFPRMEEAIGLGIRGDKWHLVNKDPEAKSCSTFLKNKPSIPPSLMEKRWLKTVLNDPRARLFDLEWDKLNEQLADVEPLFLDEDIVFFDLFNDGDPYEDKDYIDKFRFLMKAVREKTPLAIEYMTRKGDIRCVPHCIPEFLEYSSKNDKFRVKTSGSHLVTNINLADIRKVSVASPKTTSSRKSSSKKEEEKKAVHQTLVNVLTANNGSKSRKTVSFSYWDKVKKPVVPQSPDEKIRFKTVTERITLEKGDLIGFDETDETKIEVRCRNGETKNICWENIYYDTLKINVQGGSTKLKAVLPSKEKQVFLRVSSERNSQERFKQTFSYCIRKLEKKEDKWEYIRLHYDEAEEKEIVVNVLSFGPYVEVLGPEDFRGKIIKKLISQQKWRIDTDKTDKKGDKHGKEETVGS